MRGALASLGAAVHEVGTLLPLDEAHRAEVEHQHVVKLLRQLKNASEDIHLVSKCNRRVAASAERDKTSLWDLNLIPVVLGAVVLPQVVQLAIVIVLPSKHVQFVVVDATRARCADLRLCLVLRVAFLEDLPGDCLRISHGKLRKLVDS